jgi:oligopeptide/dipeptide ABC transporter ATP-binding protein
MSRALLSVRGLSTSFHRDGRRARAVDDVSFEIGEGETLALVGESGCGKTVTALSILRLVPAPTGRIEAGEVLFRGRDLLKATEAEIRKVRGGEIAMVFQDAMAALNPVYPVGRQIAEALIVHGRASRAASIRRAVELLDRVGIPAASERAKAYPHQLSGGMLQRVMIAMALSCEPALLIADEPTTALDVTVQAQILELLRRLQKDLRMSLLLITHDLGVVAELADRVAVMYAGRIVETGPVASLFDAPRHPYTAALFESIPRLDSPRGSLRAIPGDVPDPFAFPSGCRFRTRCSIAIDACREALPPLVDAAPGHASACIRLEGGRLPQTASAAGEDAP